MIDPKYVIVYCNHFGSGNIGWRLNEIDYYCYSNNYYNARNKVNEWNSYGGYDKGLSFMIKYENWLNKGGPIYDGQPYNNIRNL